MFQAEDLPLRKLSTINELPDADAAPSEPTEPVTDTEFDEEEDTTAYDTEGEPDKAVPRESVLPSGAPRPSIIKRTKKRQLSQQSIPTEVVEEEEASDDESGKCSAATSVDSEYKIKYPPDDELDQVSAAPSIITKMVQKYQRESEEDLAKKEEEPYKRHTIKSHSTTKMKKKPESFYFGVRAGTMHQGDVLFSERSRNKQSLPIAAVAYVFSFSKHPSKWREKEIDKVLELGDKLYLKSLEDLHLHNTDRALKPKELYDIVTLGDKKIKYQIHEPDIAGMTKSEDPKIFDLLKGLILFFERNRAGILQTLNTNMLIWKRKHYFVFDSTPRNTELFVYEKGTAILANFYDLQSVMVMLVDRGNIDNSPYVISRISIKKVIMEEGEGDGDSLTSDFREGSEYKIVTSGKAVIAGSYHVGDKCFEQTHGKQSLNVVVMALVYSFLTPAAAWHKRTMDKILLLGNQFYLECIKDMTTDDIKLDNIPAFFTIGPLTVDLLIYANQYAGLMYKKSACFLEEMLDKFFEKNCSAIVQIDKYVVGIWKERSMYYLFDPYSRDREGLKCVDGKACTTMNGTLRCLIDTVTYNFDNKEYIFKIHVLKVMKIDKDPEFGTFPTKYVDSETNIAETIQVTNKRAIVHDNRNITIDPTEIAMHIVDADVSLGASIIEVASCIGSLDSKYVPGIPKVPAAKPIISFPPPPENLVFDLDRPSLSDTQVDLERPDPSKVDNAALNILKGLIMEKELNTQTGNILLHTLFGEELKIVVEEEEEEEMDEEIEDEEVELNVEELDTEEEDRLREVSIQKGRDPMIGTTTTEVNTDLLGLSPLPCVVLEPTDMTKIIKQKKRAKKQPQDQSRLPDSRERKVTQEEQLRKKSNFINLPDGSQIMYGTTNITNFEIYENYEDASPYISIMAIALTRKYSIDTWCAPLVDFVLRCGFELYKAVQVNFAGFYTIEIPSFVIGSTNYHILVEYLFDSLLEPTILEASIEKILLRDFENGVVATKVYSCAVIYKRGLYYMYDGFGCNLVGLGEGPDNTGVACLFRFRNIHNLVARFMYNKKQRESIEPTEASRFIISTVRLTSIFPEEIIPPRREKILDGPAFNEEGEQMELSPDAHNHVGYQLDDSNYTTIKGYMGTSDREKVDGNIKECHFICICAMLAAFIKPVPKWDTKRVNYIVETGQNLFPYIDNTNFADKRNIKNLLIDKFFFDIIVKRIYIANPKNSRTFKTAVKFVLTKHLYFLIQFPNCCYLLHKGKKFLHLFDPYGVQKDERVACWIRYKKMDSLVHYILKNSNNTENYFFFTINVSSMKKASKWRRMEYKLYERKIKKKPKVKPLRPLHEDEEWLLVYPIPWSRMTRSLANGTDRGSKGTKWYEWDIEYPNDLYSLVGNLHQTSKAFSRVARGKQTIANCIIAIIMTEMYTFSTWNTSVLNSILRAGNDYFKECIKKITDENYEIRLEDFNKELSVHPYNVTINYEPFVEGTMFLNRPPYFDLSKALRFFFSTKENRSGIICRTREGSKPKYLAFGRIRQGEYFMYDCQTIGPPMFFDKFRSSAYMLRCLSLNRLLHVITLTLRGGDFFIYDMEIIEPGTEEEVTKVTEYAEKSEEPSTDLAEEGEGEVTA